MTTIDQLRNRDAGDLARMPVGERVLDRLGDLLYDADDILSILNGSDGTSVRWMEPTIARIYEDVNSIMKMIAD
jgi:hypothetical protein